MTDSIVRGGPSRAARRRVWNAFGTTFAALSALVLRSAHAQDPSSQTHSRETTVATQRATSPRDTVDLTLAVVHRLVTTQSPSYLAAQQAAVAARGALRQARTLRFNPDLAVVAPGTGGNASPYELTLTQEVEWAGQRGLRTGAARYGLARATAAARDVGRQTVAEGSSAYYRAIAMAQRLQLASEQATLAERLLEAIRTQAREGEVSAMEASLAEIEGVRSRARVLSARRDANSALIELLRIVGLSPNTPVRLSTDTAAAPALDTIALSERIDSLTTAALIRRPDAVAARAAYQEAEALVVLARREAVPNLRVGAVAERDRNGPESRLGATIGVGLPLFNRNQGLRDQRRAEARGAAFDAQAAELRVRADIADAVRAYALAVDEASVFATALTPARENSTRLENAYRAGKINLATLLLVRNQLLDAALGYWDAWFARQDAFVRLQAATGALSAATPSSPTTSAAPATFLPTTR